MIIKQNINYFGIRILCFTKKTRQQVFRTIEIILWQNRIIRNVNHLKLNNLNKMH